jgi:transcriptional regulator
MAADRIEFLQGTLDMLILRTLRQGPLHGYGISQTIRRASDTVLQLEAGSLYPALQRLELKGLISAQWEISEHNRRQRVYRLTPAGRKILKSEMSRWEDFVRAVSRVLYPQAAEE